MLLRALVQNTILRMAGKRVGTGLEVEVKLWLRSKKDYERLLALPTLSQERKVKHFKNMFFDGKNGQLAKEKAALRFRFINDKELVITLKSGGVLEDGIMRVGEEEAQGELEVGKTACTNPILLETMDHLVVDLARKTYHPQEWMCLGGFENQRTIIPWGTLKMEIDETKFAFGTMWELEVECVDPILQREKLEVLLKEANIDFEPALRSKFHRFRRNSRGTK